jgi:mismatch-specific thymine-DNA glycosylase
MLADYLQPGLDVVFVGLNPSLKSAAVGHYYAGPGNQFWPFLAEAGFTDRLLRPDEDVEVLKYKIGLTDFVKRATRGVNDLKDREFGEGIEDLRSKIEKFRPKFVCFNGKSGFQAAVGKCEYGLQEGDWAWAKLYVAPSTSGALPIKRAEKLAYFVQLKGLIDVN